MSRLSDNHKQILRIALRKQMIKEAGLQYSDFGRRETVYKVVNERLPHKVLRRKIARKLGRPMTEVWPDRNVRRNSGKRNTGAGR